MRIAIDCRFAHLHAGLGRYTRELVTHLLRRSDPWSYVLLVRSLDDAWVKALPAAAGIVAAPFAHYSLAEQMRLPGCLRQAKADALFSPHFNVPLKCPVPFVVTVHDLILHRYPNRASLLKQCAYRILMRSAVRRARGVIAVSDFVKDELVTAYGQSLSRRIHVVHEGVSGIFSKRSEHEQLAVRSALGLTKPFFLYVGNAKQHKQVPLLLQAFAALPSPRQELVLVMSQGEASGLSLPQGVRVLSDVSDDVLPALYSAADAFVTASAYEGFCLPAIEAIACGCPVIAADRGPLREVTRGKAMLIEPTVQAFVAALASPPDKQAPVSLWKWEDTAEQTARILGDCF
jgi:glycosyltransferase involved in cell wall biosynthesis